MKWLAVTVLSLLCGCAAVSPPTAPSKPEVVAWSGELRPQTERWAEAAEKRFGIRPVIFLCHGGETVDGRWFCYPDAPRTPMPVEAVAWLLHSEYGSKRLVMLIVCNPAGDQIHVPGVIYARRSVWNMPGPDRQPNRDLDIIDAAGDISEFQLSHPIDRKITVTRGNR